MNGKLNTVMYDDFVVLNSSDARVTGLVNGDFTKKLYNPSGTEVSGTLPGGVTVAELGNGNYRASYTPNAVGIWDLNIFHVTYFPEGKFNTHQIYTYDVDSASTEVDSIVAKNLITYLNVFK